MMDKFKEMLLKKKAEQKGKVDPSKLEAKANIMKSLSDEMGKEIGDDLTGMKKVTVASDSKEGLKDGLDKAEDMLENSEEKSSESEDSEESEEVSPEELKEKIAELEQLLEQLKKRV